MNGGAGTTGRAGTNGGGAGGAQGTGPCAGICTSPTVLTSQSGGGMNMPAGACFSTTFTIQGAECTNSTGFTVNGKAVTSCGGTAITLPAKVNGGYCFQFGTSDPTYAAFTTY
jgi:hypothetical protein